MKNFAIILKEITEKSESSGFEMRFLEIFIDKNVILGLNWVRVNKKDN